MPGNQNHPRNLITWSPFFTSAAMISGSSMPVIIGPLTSRGLTFWCSGWESVHERLFFLAGIYA